MSLVRGSFTWKYDGGKKKVPQKLVWKDRMYLIRVISHSAFYCTSLVQINGNKYRSCEIIFLCCCFKAKDEEKKREKKQETPLNSPWKTSSLPDPDQPRSWWDLIAESVANLSTSEGQLALVELQQALKIHKYTLRCLWAQITATEKITHVCRT